MNANPFGEAAAIIEASFDLRAGFLGELLHADDWSFVVKAHALIEAAVSRLLVQHFGDTRTHRVFLRLDLSDGKKGKVAFARALELLRSEEVTFIRNFSELRNNLVHDIHFVNFRFPDHIALLDSNQRKSWIDAFAYFATQEPGRSLWRDKSISDPRVTLFLALLSLLGRIHLTVTAAQEDRKRVAKELDLLRQILGDMEDEDNDDLRPPAA